ncbi:MAG: acyl carrier protein [Pirellulaceae bacterium]|jgi:acyl carrier protein|nr:acyl carrier protein [Pirellulaceae bacterium]
MLELLNQYSHGFVAIPTILACRQTGLFGELSADRGMAEPDLAEALGANTGHLRVALKLLQSIEWISRDPNGLISLEIDRDRIDEVPDDILKWWSFPLQSYLNGENLDASISSWVQKCKNSWEVSDPRTRVMLDGVLVVPILTELHQAGHLKSVPRDELENFLPSLPQQARSELSELFAQLGWLESPSVKSGITDVGRFMIDRALNVGTLCAYIPMLSRLPDLLTGDVSTVFARDQAGHEQHVERTLNVVASGFQHEKYFADVDEILVSIFDTPDPSSQPRYIADMGCGDGSFLKRVYETIASKTARGKQLDEHPLVLVGVDYNEKALLATEEMLQGVPHLVSQGDIGDPDALVIALQAAGVSDPASVLHIRSFLDHDRPLLDPQDLEQVEHRRQLSYPGAYVDNRGAAVEPAIVVQSLVEHLRRWSSLATGHGLIVLEVHSMAPSATAQYFDQSESLHFDAYHGFSMQYLVDADLFLMSAAEAGLFAQPELFRRYPKTLPYCRITLNHFEHRGYTARCMRPTDLPAVDQLRERVGPTGLMIPTDVASRILAADPFSSFVFEAGGELVAAAVGVRIAGPAALENWTSSGTPPDIHVPHDPTGATMAVLDLVVSPDFAENAPATVKFFLQQARLKTDVTSAVAVVTDSEAARSWHASCGGVLTESGAPRSAGPGESFELAHYDFDARPSTDAMAHAGANDETSDVGNLVEQLVQRLMESNGASYCSTKTFYELGLDSLDHMELATTLKKSMNVDLEVDVLYQHDTPHKLSDYLLQVTSRGSQRGSLLSFRKRRSR